MPTQKKALVLPEIALPDHKFRVKDSAKARVAFSSPVAFNVPLTAGPTDGPNYLLGQRTHELAHVRWTPKQAPGELAKEYSVPELLLQVAEDARVNLLALQAGAPIKQITEPGQLKANLDYLLAQGPCALQDLTLLRVARWFTSDEADTIKLALESTPVGRRANVFAYQAVSQGENADNFVKYSVRIAKYLDALFHVIDEEKAEAARLTASADTYEDALFGDDRSFSSMFDGLTSMTHTRAFGRVEGTKGWGKMKILTPPRYVPCSTFERGIRKVTSDCGLLPNRIHRYCTDGFIFASKASRPGGGSVLVDMSGSMHLSNGHLTRFLHAFPTAVVAVYSAHTGYTGNLTILAKDGRRLPACPPQGSGNVIDGPALRWLASQPRPRTWVCDGITTGIGDYAYGEAECRMLCQFYNIRRVASFELFLKESGITEATARSGLPLRRPMLRSTPTR